VLANPVLLLLQIDDQSPRLDVHRVAELDLPVDLGSIESMARDFATEASGIPGRGAC